MYEPVFSDGCLERQQKESEEKIMNLSRLYTGYNEVNLQFAKELEHVILAADNQTLSTDDLEYLGAFCVALRRETVLKHRKFQ